MGEAVVSVWNEDRLTALKKLWGEGLSITQIGLAIGVSRNAVVGKVHRMGLPKRQSPILRSDKPRTPRRRKSTPLGLADWDRGKCSWPIGDPKNEDFKFCGEKIVAGRPYCEEHCVKAYTTLKESAA
ncbi:MAG: global cell cycle regulator GcrA-like protein [Rhodospirillaceae bacterium]|jgi:GcrA cell cycle regulator|nr:global cell cycle regulator GcrA-like protein [Rhodospirillaceae bacterium]MBT6137108.1 global cell cycle regulator GcrA-like protein [Rhodospirillaceae bacterium]